jgi:hypothetical protein
MPTRTTPDHKHFVKTRSVRTWTVPTDPGGLPERLDRTLRRLTGAPPKGPQLYPPSSCGPFTIF